MTIPQKPNNGGPKPRSGWTKEEARKVSLEYRAYNVLMYALSENEFLKISSCSTFKEI